MPQLIFKYRTWENLIQRRSITNNECFFASPKILNDPLELVNQFHYEQMKYDDKIKFITRIFSDNNKYKSEQERIDNARKWIDSDSKEGFIKLKKHGKKTIKDLRKKIGVFSTAKSGDNNHLWANYANNYKGFCIGYDQNELISYISKKYNGVSHGNVVYNESLPVIIPNPYDFIYDFPQLCLIKTDDWSLEDEYRLSKFNFSNSTTTIKSSIIKEIIIGENMDSKSKKQLIKYVKRKYKECEILIAKKKGDITVLLND